MGCSGTVGWDAAATYIYTGDDSSLKEEMSFINQCVDRLMADRVRQHHATHTHTLKLKFVEFVQENNSVKLLVRAL